MKLRLNIIKPTPVLEKKEEEKKQEETEKEIEDFEDTNDLFEGPIVEITGTQEILQGKETSWKFIPLFKEKANGEIRVWQIGFDFNGSRLKTIHGAIKTTKGESGKLQTAYHPIVTNNSGRSLQEQALLEARRRYLDQQTEKKYYAQGETLTDKVEPMLAKTLKVGEGSLKSNEIRLQNYPVSVMPKIDGIRCLAYLKNGQLEMSSRNNKKHEAPLTHIKNEIGEFLRYLPAGCRLDGELYSLDMPFEELSGVIRTKKGVHAKHHLVKFFIFDIITPRNMHWLERYALLCNAFQQYVNDSKPCQNFTVVQTYTANNEKELVDFHGRFVSEGYEGLIVRRYVTTEVTCCIKKIGDPDSLCKKCKKGYELSIYRSGRTNAMMKYKLFQDEEVKIIGFDVGVGTEEGCVIFKVVDVRGNEFTVRPRGTVEEKRKMYKKKEKLLGLPLTIRFQELSEKGVPRFPVAICIRNYE